MKLPFHRHFYKLKRRRIIMTLIQKIDQLLAAIQTPVTATVDTAALQADIQTALTPFATQLTALTTQLTALQASIGDVQTQVDEPNPTPAS